ncbi:unnamed protein product, partial [Adineta ricciae]
TVSWMPLVDAGTLLTWLIIGLSAAVLVRRECWNEFCISGDRLTIGGDSGTGCPFSKANPALAQSFDPGTYGT